MLLPKPLLAGKVADLKEYLSPLSTPILYLLSVVLEKASKPEEIIDVLLRVTP